MRGHLPLIAMRKAGSAPDWVFIDTEKDNARQWQDWSWIDNRTAHVEILAADRNPDLRFVVGLKVYVDGLDVARVHKLRDACVTAGAARVVTSVCKRFGDGEFVAFQLQEWSDTAKKEAAHG